MSTNHARATVPDYEDAVYHPAMTALKWPAAALVAMLAFPAHADVSGPACVTDGDTLVVNGKRKRTRCVGGTRVRLFGIDAPDGLVVYIGKSPAGPHRLVGDQARQGGRPPNPVGPPLHWAVQAGDARKYRHG